MQYQMAASRMTAFGIFGLLGAVFATTTSTHCDEVSMLALEDALLLLQTSSGVKQQGQSLAHRESALSADTSIEHERVEVAASVAKQNEVEARKKLQGSLSKQCVKAPQCLDPSEKCMTMASVVRAWRPECSDHKEFCDKSVYQLSNSGMKMTLPVMTPADLTRLYSTSYSGQAPWKSPQDWRPSQQANMVLQDGGIANKTGLTIVEMGCASGFVLYNLRHQASNGGALKCFEADPDEHASLRQTFQKAKGETPELTTELIPQLFDANKLQANSVDVFLSSQTLEHFADPCPWLEGLKRVLKPGGLVFTEVPEQDQDPAQGVTRGQYHLLYFNQGTFVKMMEAAGFENVATSTVGQPFPGDAVRSIFRKPLH